MPKASPIQSNFSGGEISPFVKGRVDSDRYKISLDTCENYIPLSSGAITRRPGTYFVAEVKDSSKEVRLVRFIFSTTQAYILEFGDEYIRFYRNNGQIVESGVDIASITNANPAVLEYSGGSDTFANSDEVFISGVNTNAESAPYLNNRNFLVANVDTGANTFELTDLDGNDIDLSGLGAINPSDLSSASVSEVYEISSPYAEEDLFGLNFIQSTDTLFITHPDYAPRQLTRTGHTAWTLSTITFLKGPYLPENTTAVTLTPTDSTANSTTMTASSALFASTDVGRKLRYKATGGNWVDFYISAFSNSTSVTVTREDGSTAAVNTSASDTWRLGIWSGTTGYPAVVAFHEDRLTFGGATADPARFDMSVGQGDYFNFAPTITSDGVDIVTDDLAVSRALNSRDAENVRWMVSEERALLIGTPGGEWAVRPSVQSEAISPLNVNAKQVSSFGSAAVTPNYSGKATLFVQSSKRTLRELSYYYESDGFRAPDLTALADHIAGDDGFKQLARQKERPAIIWAVREDGELAGMTYEREEDALIAAWHRHILGGQSDAAGSAAVVESCEVIPSATGTWDELWLVVRRHINGVTKRYVEYMTRLFEHEDEQKDAYHVDCGLTYDSPVSITGVTAANPVVVTAPSHSLSNGDVVIISGVKGMTELNGNSYTVRNQSANTTFELEDMDGNAVDGSAFTAYVSSGQVRKFVTTITGLWHLEGESVAIYGDGATQPSATVTDGAITLPNRAATVHIGYAMRSRGRRLRDTEGAADGTTTGKTRRIHRIAFDFYRTLGFKFGMSFDSLEEITFRKTTDPDGRPPSLFTGVKSVTVNGNYEFDSQICWEQSDPSPGTILAIAPQLHVEDRG